MADETASQASTPSFTRRGPGSDLLGRCREALETSGLFVTRELESLPAYRAFCPHLGTEVCETEVRLIPSSGRRPHRTSALRNHTDPATVRWVAWWCVWPGASSEWTYIVDGRKMLHELDPRTRDLLRWVAVESSDVARGRTVWTPLVSGPEGAETLSYSPDHVSPSLPRLESAAVARWEELLTARQNDATCVNWRPGLAVFLDNHRMLHARPSIGVESSRFLLRSWIYADDR